MDTGDTPWGQDSAQSSQKLPHTECGGRPPKRRREYPPQNAPENLGAGPSNGRLLMEDHGGGPAKRESARRRDGDVDPASLASAACGSGGAAAQGRREEPSKGSCRQSVHNARNSECSSIGRGGTKGSSAGPGGDLAAAAEVVPAGARSSDASIGIADDWKDPEDRRHEEERKVDTQDNRRHTKRGFQPQQAAAAAGFAAVADADYPSGKADGIMDLPLHWEEKEPATHYGGGNRGLLCGPRPPPHRGYSEHRTGLEIAEASRMRSAWFCDIPGDPARHHGLSRVEETPNEPCEGGAQVTRNGPEVSDSLGNRVLCAPGSGDDGIGGVLQERPNASAQGLEDPGGGRRPREQWGKEARG